MSAAKATKGIIAARAAQMESEIGDWLEFLGQEADPASDEYTDLGSVLRAAMQALGRAVSCAQSEADR